MFEGQKRVPLTTQCSDNRARYRDYVMKEYLAYRINGLLTEASVRARLVHLRIRNYGSLSPGDHYSAFFTEHFNDMAERLGYQRVEAEQFSPLQADPQELTEMALFQYLIGNTDWSYIDSHNITHLRRPDGQIAAVPYDFDFSGLVNAEYAGPPPRLPIRSVTHRLYRGFCLPELDWQAAYQPFQDHREAIFGLVDELPGLSGYRKRNARSFLQKFYQVIDSESKRYKKIETACRELR